MEKWLTCKIEKGMFSDEFTVLVTNDQGEAISVFVPKSKVDGAKVRVRAFTVSDRTFAVLPDERHTAVLVKLADLQTA
jgi:hypothetical protein